MRVFAVLLAVFLGLLAFTWFDSLSTAGEDADVEEDIWMAAEGKGPGPAARRRR